MYLRKSLADPDHMERKIGNESHPDRLVEADMQSCGPCPSSTSEMKRRSMRRCSLLFLVLLLISVASLATKLLHIVLPSLYPCDESPGIEPHLEVLYSQTAQLPNGHFQESFYCNRSSNLTDTCFLRGNVLLLPVRSNQNVLVQLFSTDNNTWHGEQRIQPYPRKYDLNAMGEVEYVTLQSKKVLTSQSEPTGEACLAWTSVPLLLFSAGGYTGNPYHDFQDVLVPLFVTSKVYNGEIVFAVSQGRKWWLKKFYPLLKQMTKYEILDLSSDQHIYCFHEATVGLHLHGELKVDPSRMPHNESMKNFQEMLKKAYGEPRDTSQHVGNVSNCLTDVQAKVKGKCPKPRLVILARNQSRIILNQAQVANTAKKNGFEVQILNPWGGTELSTLYRQIHNADVMMGVHGAALTHMIFMRPRTVLIQIVPLGTDWPSSTYYEEPAINNLDLQYIEYRVSPEESTLTQSYGPNHPVVRDPETVIAKNWDIRKKIYMEGQNVRLSLEKVASILQEARHLLTPGTF